MSITRYPSSGLVRELQQELFPLMSWMSETHPLSQETVWAPKVDIREEKKQFVVLADIPGVDPDSIEINMEGNALSLKGERRTLHEDKDPKHNYYRVERTTGKFYREFTLPENVDASNIAAKTKQGVLTITIPKVEQGTHQRKIKVEEE